MSILPFRIERYEVTNARYDLCVKADICLEPAVSTNKYYDQEEGIPYSSWPVTGVDARNAAAFCNFTDRRLPTYPEWYYAATQAGNADWPLGQDPAKCLNVNLDCVPNGQPPKLTPELQAVTTISEDGDSFNDLIGSVQEWTSSAVREDNAVIAQAWDGTAATVPARLVVIGGHFKIGNSTARVREQLMSPMAVPNFPGTSERGFRCAESALALPIITGNRLGN